MPAQTWLLPIPRRAMRRPGLAAIAALSREAWPQTFMEGRFRHTASTRRNRLCQRLSVPILSARGTLGRTITWAARLDARAVINLALRPSIGQGASCQTTGNGPDDATLGQVMTREPADNGTLDTALRLGRANANQCDECDRCRFSHDPHDTSPNLCRTNNAV